MDGISLLALYLIPLFVLIFALRFRGILALMLLVPVALLLAATIILSSDPNITFTQQTPVLETENVVASNVVQFDSYTTLSEVTSRATSNPARGQIFKVGSPDLGDEISCVQIHARKELSPTGTLMVGVFNGDIHGHFKVLFGIKDISTLTATSQSYQFCLPDGGKYTIVEGDIIGSLYNGGDATNYLVVASSSTDIVSGSNLIRLSATGGAWTDTTLTNEFVSIYTLSSVTTNTTITNSPVETTVTLDSRIATFLQISGYAVGGLLIFLTWRRVSSTYNKSD